jgi:hypothetical protein
LRTAAAKDEAREERLSLGERVANLWRKKKYGLVSTEKDFNSKLISDPVCRFK